ncbi:lipopolysaccharide biosynthesis protein [Hydrogenophilus islandicus]
MNARERKTGSGMVWTIARALVQLVLSIGVGVALARLLSPHDFGVVAIATGFSVLAESLALAGLGSALIQRPTVRRATAETTLLLSLLAAALFLLLFTVAAAPLASWFQAPELATILPIIGVTQGVMTLGIVPRSVMRRHLRFQALATIDLVSYTLGYGAVSIVLAWLGWGALSLAMGLLAWWLIATLACWLVGGSRRWRPRWDRDEGKAILRYGLTLSGKSFVVYLASALDSLLLGWLLGPAPLGLYQRAAQLALIPLQRLAATIGQVMFPAFSLVQLEPAKLRTAFLASQQTLALVCLPILAALAAVPETVIVGLYGEPWREAAPVLRILALVVIVDLTHHLAGPLVEACGQAGRELRIQMLFVLLQAASLVIAARWGLTAAAAAHMIPSLFLAVAMVRMASRIITLDWCAWLATNRAGLLLAAAVAASAAATVHLWRATSAAPHPVGELMAVAIICAAVYAVGLWRIPGPHQAWWRRGYH